MPEFSQNIRRTLVDHKAEFMSLWTGRLKGLAISNNPNQLTSFTEVCYKVLLDYFSDLSPVKAMASLKSLPESNSFAFNALSISRYALLALLPYENSLECFSRLNEAYAPLLESVHALEKSINASPAEQLHQTPAFARYFENILNDAADAIILLDAQDCIVMWNNAAEAIYGWTRSEILGQPVSRIVPQDAASQKEIEWISRQTREKGYVRNFRTRRLTRDNKTVTIEVTRTAIQDEQGRYIGSSVISRDLTEQEKLRDQLVHSEKLSAVGTLAAGIAHEIGSPLTAISSISQLLQVKTKEPWFVEQLAIIQQSIDRIARIVRTLVDFSRPIPAKVERIYMNTVVEDVIQIIKYDRRLKYRNIETDLQPDIPQVKASFDQLLQVLINLCLNAADALEERPQGTLTIRTWCANDLVFTSVSDNGCGIRPEHLPHIFEPFFTTKGERHGTGLGLWVSYNIIKNFSGKIEVNSEPDQGTTFIIALPAHHGEAR